jgi:nucleoside-diphosphate-sugar epimerase
MAHHVIVGSGAVGSTVAELLVDAGHTVRVVTRRGTGPERPEVERVAADATDADRLTTLTRGAVALYNCANPPYDRWLTDWPPLASSLLTAAERTGAGLVTMGNLYGYGPVEGPMTEHTPPAATGAKGRVRNRMWADMLAAHEAGRARVTEARASDFYGPGPVDTSHLGQYFTPRLLAGRRPVVLGGNLDVPHSFTFLPDVARTLVTLAGDDRAWGRPWHVPTAPAATLREITTRMAAIAGVPDRGVLVVPHPLLRVAGLVVPFMRELEEVRYQFTRPFVLDSTAAQATFGLAPTPLEEGLSAHVRWWAQRQPATTAVRD